MLLSNFIKFMCCTSIYEFQLLHPIQHDAKLCINLSNDHCHKYFCQFFSSSLFWATCVHIEYNRIYTLKTFKNRISILNWKSKRPVLSQSLIKLFLCEYLYGIHSKLAYDTWRTCGVSGSRVSISQIMALLLFYLLATIRKSECGHLKTMLKEIAFISFTLDNTQ